MCSLNLEVFKERVVNAIVVVVSVLIRLGNLTMSVVVYRILIVLFYSGVSYNDFIRLNYFGICMSYDMMVVL